jgi:hypothetical protein
MWLTQEPPCRSVCLSNFAAPYLSASIFVESQQLDDGNFLFLGGATQGCGELFLAMGVVTTTSSLTTLWNLKGEGSASILKSLPP